MPKAAVAATLPTRTNYLRDDLARDLRGLLPGLELSARESRMVVDTMMLRISEVLLEGRVVRLRGLFGLWLVPGKKTVTTTPQGQRWTGVRKPTLRTVLYKDLLKSMALKASRPHKGGPRG